MLSLRLVLSGLLLAFAVAACSDDSSFSVAAQPAPTAQEPVASRIAIVRRRIAASNDKDWATWESLHTETAVRTAPELPAPLQGVKAMRSAIEGLVTTFPDYHLELVDAFGSGDQVVARIHTRATMLGPMPIGAATIPPTGKSFEQEWIAVLRFEGDRIAAIDEFHDNYGILLQLGLAASPRAA